MARTKKPKSTARGHSHDRHIGKNRGRLASPQAERTSLGIAGKIRALRTKAGLSQREFAQRIGTSASNICRLEHADYQGHSLSMLRRIAAAFKMRVDVRFLPIARK